MRHLRALALLAALLGILAFTTACGNDDGTDPGSEASSGPVEIDVTIKGGKATPSGEIVEVERGQEVLLSVTADEPGELHVHSEPEQTHSFPAGTTRHITLGSFDTPGRYAIEDHSLHLTIATLEVK